MVDDGPVTAKSSSHAAAPLPIVMSLAEARRIALAAQGFGAPRAQDEAGKRDVRRVFERLGVVQIDSVNVLARAHTLPAFSRLGRYRTADLHALAYGGRKRALFEYWGHEASLLPVALQPLLRWRMARAERGEGIYGAIARFGRERRELIEQVRREIAERGPLAAGELSHQHKGEGGWWGWSEGKRAVEWLFWAGAVTTATRRGTFERVYGLTEHVLPRSVIETPTPDEADAQRELLRISARCLGVATERCLRDYFRLGPADARPRIAELVEAGELIPTAVQGWDRIAYLEPRGPAAAAHGGAGAAGAVRSTDLAAGARRGAVRRAHPARALHAAREAHARLLRAAVPAGRPHRGACGSQGRPCGFDFCACRRRTQRPASRWVKSRSRSRPSCA